MIKGFLVEGRVDCSLSQGCDIKSVYNGEMKDWFNEIWLKVKIIGKCSKFLINIDSFL